MATRFLFSWLVALAVIGLSSGCDDPCVRLAERICECEPSPSARESCRQDRIETLNGNVEITEDELLQCEAALQTCDCQVLKENETQLCGFTRD